MRLYHCPDARSFRPLWTLEELGVDYELTNMRFPPRTEYPGYLGINPLGTVPTFVDGELTMTESTGICHYLVERHAPNDLRVGPGDAAYGDYLNWLYRSDATLTFPQTIVLRYTRLEPPARRDFLCAGRFTIADIAVHFALYLGETLGLSERYKPNCRRYLERLKERAAFQRALARQREPAD